MCPLLAPVLTVNRFFFFYFFFCCGHIQNYWSKEGRQYVPFSSLYYLDFYGRYLSHKKHIFNIGNRKASPIYIALSFVVRMTGAFLGMLLASGFLRYSSSTFVVTFVGTFVDTFVGTFGGTFGGTFLVTLWGYSWGHFWGLLLGVLLGVLWGGGYFWVTFSCTLLVLFRYLFQVA